jgi:hypothetical protein
MSSHLHKLHSDFWAEFASFLGLKDMANLALVNSTACEIIRSSYVCDELIDLGVNTSQFSADNFPVLLRKGYLKQHPSLPIPEMNSRVLIASISFHHTMNDEIVTGSLPPGLRHLSLGGFDHPLMLNVLPQTLVSLFLGYSFNHPILLNVLPRTLQHLRLGRCFDQRLEEGTLPTSLLTFGLENLRYSHAIEPGVFPPSMTAIRLGNFIPTSTARDTLVFPRRCLEELQITNCFSKPFQGTYPDSLLTLTFGIHRYTGIVDYSLVPGDLPPNLTTLKFSPTFDQPILHDVLPRTLQTLVFGIAFNHRLEMLLPPSLTELEFGAAFNQPLTGSLPPHLKKLKLGERFDQSIHEGDLPDGLEHFEMAFQSRFNLHTHSIILVKSLRTVKLPCRWMDQTGLVTEPINGEFLEKILEWNSWFPTQIYVHRTFS